MSDDDEADAEQEPAVELGEETPVEGAPLARIASRLSWPKERSHVIEREGDVTIRTPDGPRTLESVLADVDVTYFQSRQEFTDAVFDAIGRGPVPTE